MCQWGACAHGPSRRPDELVEAARAVARLTHGESDAGESSALWCLMIRHAVLTGELPVFDNVAAHLPQADRWCAVLAEAEAHPPSSFTNNGWTVGALQAAWSAVAATLVPPVRPADGLVAALTTAIRMGNDTDTAAAIAIAIAGALLGARWGTAALPDRWLAMLHGSPGLDAAGAGALARRIVGRAGG